MGSANSASMKKVENKEAPVASTTSTTTTTTTAGAPDRITTAAPPPTTTTSGSSSSTAPLVVDVSDAELKRQGKFVPLVIYQGGMGYNDATKALLKEIGGMEAILEMTTIFYKKFWADPYLKQFLGELHTDLETHARRIGMYFCEMLGMSGSPWTKDTHSRHGTPAAPLASGRSIVVDSRQAAHFAAWNSKTRPANRVGRRFKLDDCRVWMCLMFWACRESGLANHAPFFSYYKRWIAHFIPVYEQTAVDFVRESARWSADPKNIETYLSDGRVMKDVLNVDYYTAIKSLPADEKQDDNWAYEDSVNA